MIPFFSKYIKMSIKTKAKQYIERLLIGSLIYIFLYINARQDADSTFQFTPLDVIIFIYTLTIVIVIWEVINTVIKKIKTSSMNLNGYRDLVKLFFILSFISLPFVATAAWVSEFIIKAKLECCNTSFDGFIKSTMQGGLLAWLLILKKIIELNLQNTKKIENDKALMQKELFLSQYLNLKNQVKPHFLFNSFSVLQSLIDTRSKDEASQFLAQLSKIYRYILEQKEASMARVKKELEILNSYVYLLMIRHGNSLKVVVDVSEKYFDLYVPILSLQILLENVIKHNQFSKSEPMIVYIYVEKNYLTVKNRVKKKKVIVQSTKMGLKNIIDQYRVQTVENVIIEEDDQFFFVKLPILSSLRLS